MLFIKITVFMLTMFCISNLYATDGLPYKIQESTQDLKINNTISSFSQQSNNLRFTTTYSPAFHMDTHKDLLEKLLLKDKSYQSYLMRALYFQDIFGQVNSAAHFDNCNFKGSINLINSKISEIDSKLAHPEDNEEKVYQDVFYKLGEAVHAIQDFYAHSNYIETMTENPNIKNVNDIKVIPVWTKTGADEVFKMQKNGLYSGYFFLGSPNLCPKNTKTHKELAKDSNKTISGKIPVDKFGLTQFETAKVLASRATEDFFSFAYNRWPKLQPKFKDIKFTVLEHPVTENQ